MAAIFEQDPHRPIQYLAPEVVEVPQKFICRDTPPGPTPAALPVVDIPAIDLGRLMSSSSPAETNEELKKLYSALTTWGCFQVVNHGIEDDFLDELRENGRKFFKLPLEEKQKYARAENGVQGYGNDMVVSENSALDWIDRIYLTVYPVEKRLPQLWPENPQSFRGVLVEYVTTLRKIVETLLKSMAKTINLPENTFLDRYGQNPFMNARYNFYPPCPRPDIVNGVRPHSDGSAITVFLPDKEVEGLQLFKDGQWFRVSFMPHSLLVNTGDQIEIMSNGIFESPWHRAVTNAEKDRMSMVVFCSPEGGKEIGPVEELITDERPRKYKTVTNFIKSYFDEQMKGKQRPLEAFKMHAQ